MIDYLGYNLTEYKAFRQLELEFIKTITINQTLQSQVDTLRQAYDQKCSELLSLKNQEMRDKIRVQNHNLKYKKLYKQLLEQVELTVSSLKNNNKPSPKGNKQIPQNSINNQSRISQEPQLNQSSINASQNDKSLFMHLEQSQSLQKITKKLTEMTKNYQSMQEKNISLMKRIQTFESLYKTETMEKEKTQMMIVKQVQHLEAQLQELNQVNVELEAKLNIKDKERRKLDVEIRLYKQEISELQQKIQQFIRQKQTTANQQDTQFTIDFMTFQIHTIQSLFTRIIHQTKHSPDISNIMSVLYSDYEELSQIFRQKLQVQYDLEELQQRYKSQKSSPEADESLLIQTRRQIQAFRLELLKQKELFRQKELFVEEHLQEYNKINEQEMKIRNYSYELENRLYKQKRSGIQTSQRFVTTRNPTARQILLKRTIDISDKPSQTNTNAKNIYSNTKDLLKHHTQEETYDKEDSSNMPSKKASLRFKQTHNAQEIMNEIIKKDKINMEKILKDTRKTAVPIYLGK